MSHTGSDERRLRGWQLVGTDKWWPAMFGPPPRLYGPADALHWTPIYEKSQLPLTAKVT